MIFTKTLKSLFFISIAGLSTLTSAQNSPIIGNEAFAQDIDILEATLTKLHPGVYRYQSRQQVQELLEELRQQPQAISITDAYLKLTKFTAQLKCSHTHTNPWNQNDVVKSLTSEKANKLPFTIKSFEERHYVDFSAIEHVHLAKGTELVSINQIAINELMIELGSYITADGINPAKIRQRLSWSQGQKYQWFDILLPLLSPPTPTQDSPSKTKTDEQGWYYRIAVKDENGTIQNFNVQAMSAQERAKMLASKYNFKTKTEQQMWHGELLENNTAYLKIETFTTYKMTMNWQAHLDGLFAKFAQVKAKNLILDIRGNEGGMYDVAEYLYPYIINKAMTVKSFEERMRYKIVPDSLRPYLSTWNPDIYDVSNIVSQTKITTNAGDFWQLNSPKSKTYKPNTKNNFEKIILLTDAANSSATFIMSRLLKTYQRGQVQLVGETLGGNPKGQNGGQMFFLKLPNSQISIDIPLIGFFNDDAIAQENSDVKTNYSQLIPDVLVSNSYEDWLSGYDRVLQTAINITSEQPQDKLL